ncbi:MAG: hypothetical protein HOK30_06525, partial [Rhodospirillaceae bacterium]|nr:hypothetical protein [Rhodospirillaceae bacterium]
LVLLALMPALLIIGAHIILQFLADWFVLDGRLIGPDAYMRVLRVMELAQGGNWYDAVSERSNAPFGEILHWTRPLDVLLLLGGFLGSVVTDFDSALFVWAALISPVVHLLTLLVLLWACRPLFPKGVETHGLLLLGLLFAVQFFISFQFAIGRPDHHGLNTMLFIWQMGFAIRLSRSVCPSNFAMLAAIPATFALWISIEGGLGTAMLLFAMTLAWITQGAPFLRRMTRFLSFLCLGLIMALIVERPPHDLLALEYDRLSAVHLAFIALLALFSLAAGKITRPDHRPIHRLGLALAAGAGTVTIMGLWLPDILQGPMAKMAPLVQQVWFANNAEVNPLLKLDDLRRTGPKVLTHLGLGLFAVPALLHLIRQSRGEIRRNWIILAVFLGLSLVLALREGRWVGYPQVLFLPPCIALLLYLFQRLGGPGLGRAAVRVSAAIVLATGPLIGGGLLRQALPLPKTGKPCELHNISAFLNENYVKTPLKLVNFIYSGPELLYRTRHYVVATPYHRNTAGIIDTILFLRDVDDQRAKTVAKRRGVDLVLICPGDPEAKNYRNRDGAPSLYMRLEASRPPSWLKQAVLPPELAEKFRLFEVKSSEF